MVLGTVALGDSEPSPSHRKDYSVKDRVLQFGGEVRRRVGPKFKAAGLSLPPKALAYVVFKDTNVLQVYGRETQTSKWRYVTTYPVLKASGVLGPKLREGDGQVPEGIYRVESLNPNSAFHVSLRVGYPNKFDRKQGKTDGRTALGGDIMIHGSNVSIGCLAMGDRVAEDLFVLAALTGVQRVEVVISPTDFRRQRPSPVPTRPSWVGALYATLRTKLQSFPQ